MTTRLDTFNVSVGAAPTDDIVAALRFIFLHSNRNVDQWPVGITSPVLLSYQHLWYGPNLTFYFLLIAIDLTILV